MKVSGIYKIQSVLLQERCYIGSAVDIKDRWRCHLKDLNKSKHGSKKLQRHYNKYGIDDLEFSIITECSKEELLNKEQFYIDSCSPCFNCCKIAGSQLGYKWSEESILKMKGNKNGCGNKGIKLTEEQKNNLKLTYPKEKRSQVMMGKNKGKVHSIEQNIKHNKAISGRIPWNKGLKKIPILIQAVKELQQEIKELKNG